MTPFQPRRLLATLADNEVECIVIGGVASAAHGSIRTTQDLDVLCSRTTSNYERLAAALTELGARVKGSLRPPQQVIAPALLEGVRLMTFETDCGELDVFFEVPGMSTYRGMAERAVSMEVAGRTIQVVSLPDLVQLKRATGRAADAEVADELERLSELERLESPPEPL